MLAFLIEQNLSVSAIGAQFLPVKIKAQALLPVRYLINTWSVWSIIKGHCHWSINVTILCLRLNFWTNWKRVVWTKVIPLDWNPCYSVSPCITQPWPPHTWTHSPLPVLTLREFSKPTLKPEPRSTTSSLRNMERPCKIPTSQTTTKWQGSYNSKS